MRTPLLIACWLAVAVLGTFLRFDDLSGRPFHADEATGARITAHRMASTGYVFDPVHYHGPSLSAIGGVGARLQGIRTWSGLEKSTLRALPAIAGSLLVLVPLLGRRRFGDAAMLIAATALSTSPLLVYYSRMYIHEILLALFGALALFQLASAKRWWPAGIWIGMMFATKETFAISMLAWTAAGAVLYGLGLIRRQVPAPQELWKHHGRQAGLAVGLALLTSLAFYTNGFTHWQGAVDSVRTYFVYEPVEGHDKPWHYYLQLLLAPRELAAAWWFETTVALPALAALTGSLCARSMSPATRAAIQFLALAALLHLLIYSVIAYKTPWLMVLPWVHVCLLAGFVVTIPLPHRFAKVGVAAALVACFASQFLQSRRATGRFASDERNPYAYVPTSEDIESLPAWFSSLDEALPERSVEPIGVVGDDYWPLPWYLRHYDQVGYWTSPPESLERLPLVLATADLTTVLASTHIPVPRGLRTDSPLIVWVRTDFWDASLAAPADE